MTVYEFTLHLSIPFTLDIVCTIITISGRKYEHIRTMCFYVFLFSVGNGYVLCGIGKEIKYIQLTVRHFSVI